MKQYEVKVGNLTLKVREENSNEALNKAIDIWHKRNGLRTRWRPAAYILSSNPVLRNKG